MDTSDYTACSICLHDFDDLDHQPKILQICNHTFCKHCLTKLSEVTDNDIIICPICREKSTLLNLNTNIYALAFTKHINLLTSTVVDDLERQLEEITTQIEQKQKEISNSKVIPTYTEKFIPMATTSHQEYTPTPIASHQEYTPTPIASHQEYVTTTTVNASTCQDFAESDNDILKMENFWLKEELKRCEKDKEKKIKELKIFIEELQSRLSKRQRLA